MITFHHNKLLFELKRLIIDCRLQLTTTGFRHSHDKWRKQNFKTFMIVSSTKSTISFW